MSLIFYEKFPYPNYPIFLPLAWRQAYGVRSNFSWSLANYLPSSTQTRVLVAGCGDTSAYIQRKLESKTTTVDACDLSLNNIHRAKSRLFFFQKSSQLVSL